MAKVTKPPVLSPMFADGVLTLPWSLFFAQLAKALSGPVQLSSYTVATVPKAAENEGALIYVSDEAGGKTVAVSDGLVWRRLQDRAVIS